MKILLIGREGQLAWELRRTLACVGDVIALDRRSDPLALDLSDPDSLRHAVTTIRPQLIVNAAGYTAVDQAESDVDRAVHVNGHALAVLSEMVREIGASLIHYSTDYVFSGQATRPYTETDSTSPRNVYGESKRAGEIAIQQAGVPHLILRTSWVYGARGRNFLMTMLRLMAEQSSLNIVDDQRGAPTWSRQIAEATALMVARCLESDRFIPGERSGIYHVTCQGSTSWHGFAREIQRIACASGLLPKARATLVAVPGVQYPTPAKRPAYSVLCNDKLQDTFSLRLPPWRQALQLCLDELAGMPRSGKVDTP